MAGGMAYLHSERVMHRDLKVRVRVRVRVRARVRARIS